MIDLSQVKFLKFIFESTASAWLWLMARLYVGTVWLLAGWEKIKNSAWVGGDAGKALSGFIKGALSKTGGAHPDVQSWYAFFLEHFILPNTAIWSYVIAYGELLVGIALILGLFTITAAFFGAFMNFNYLLAGTVSVNPILFLLSILILLAWRVAGHFGLDNFVLKH